jgi:hypothetical protein
MLEILPSIGTTLTTFYQINARHISLFKGFKNKFLIIYGLTKLTNIILLIDIYHTEKLYLSTINVANSIKTVNKITEDFTSLQDEIQTKLSLI